MLSETKTKSEQRIASPRDTVRLSPEILAIILHDLDVPLVSIPKAHRPIDMPSPALLLTALASSNEARLRTALIPLLLRHPEYALHAQATADALPATGRSSFMCYYSAAVILQRKYQERLAGITDGTEFLPELFSTELNLPETNDPDEILKKVADRHREFSGRALNWLGTYEHAANRWMTHVERQQAWAT